MMSELIWTHGCPETEGFYWYNTQLKIHAGEVMRALVVEIKQDPELNWYYGPYGSGPLKYVYRPEMDKYAIFAKIPQPKEWQELSVISGKENFGWVKIPKGEIGFGILDRGWHANVHGTWIWANSSEHGSYVGFNEGYKFCPIEAPRV